MLSLVTPTGEALKMSLYKYNDNKGFSIYLCSTETKGQNSPLVPALADGHADWMLTFTASCLRSEEKSRETEIRKGSG